MINFYLFPYMYLVYYIMLLALVIGLETGICLKEFLYFSQKDQLNYPHYFEITILAYCSYLLIILARLSRQKALGFLLPLAIPFIQYVLYALILIISIIIWGKHQQSRTLLLAIIISGTLPYFANYLQGNFIWLLYAITFALMLRASVKLWQLQQDVTTQLSFLSIKEGIDTMNFGLLFYKHSHHNHGQIVLQNEQMQALAAILGGKLFYNGQKFYQMLASGLVQANCQKIEMGDQFVYQLPDQSVWLFEQHPITSKHHHYYLITAFDISQYYQATKELELQHQLLLERNRELKIMHQNLVDICRTEEMINTKIRVHNILGERISLLLSALRKQKKPDIADLKQFIDSLFSQLQKQPEYSEHSLTILKNNFATIGVQLTITGQLPKRLPYAKIFYEIIQEATTNAIRHGHASTVQITIRETADQYTLQIADNGQLSKQDILEGGGLTSMRKKAFSLNGEFSYTTKPSFQIQISVPKGCDIHA